MIENEVELIKKLAGNLQNWADKTIYQRGLGGYLSI